MTYKTLISDTRLPQGNESIDLNLKQPTRAQRPLLHPASASVAIQFNGITVNPIGDTGFEPVTLPVLPVLRTTISTNLEELPPRAFFRLLALTPCNQEAFAYVTGKDLHLA